MFVIIVSFVIWLKLYVYKKNNVNGLECRRFREHSELGALGAMNAPDGGEELSGRDE